MSQRLGWSVGIWLKVGWDSADLSLQFLARFGANIVALLQVMSSLFPDTFWKLVTFPFPNRAELYFPYFQFSSNPLVMNTTTFQIHYKSSNPDIHSVHFSDFESKGAIGRRSWIILDCAGQGGFAKCDLVQSELSMHMQSSPIPPAQLWKKIEDLLLAQKGPDWAWIAGSALCYRLCNHQRVAPMRPCVKWSRTWPVSPSDHTLNLNGIDRIQLQSEMDLIQAWKHYMSG